MEQISEEIIMSLLREAIILQVNQSFKDIKAKDPDFPLSRISDTYHTFGELYEHRYMLWIKLCFLLHYMDLENGGDSLAWKCLQNADGTKYDGYFLLGYGHDAGDQITYHIPLSYWGMCGWATEVDIHDYDGHTSADVLERLKSI